MEDLGKLQETYNQIIVDRRKEVSFKIPKLLHFAMKDAMQAEGWKNLSGYYIHQIGFSFYCIYKQYFDELLSGQVPKQESLLLDELPSCELSQHDLQKVISYGSYKSPIRSRSCPAILIDVSNYIRICLDSKESKDVFFRRLTLPIAIQVLQERIEEKIISIEQGDLLEASAPKMVSKQLNLNKW